MDALKPSNVSSTRGGARMMKTMLNPSIHTILEIKSGAIIIKEMIYVSYDDNSKPDVCIPLGHGALAIHF